MPAKIVIFTKAYVAPYIDTFSIPLFALAIQCENCFSSTSYITSEFMSGQWAMVYDSVCDGNRDTKLYQS